MSAVLERAKEKARDESTNRHLTGEEFLEAMRSGWRELEYTNDVFFRTKNGRSMSTDAAAEVGARERIVSCCALGAAAYALEVSTVRLNLILPWILREKIAIVSNEARGKNAAIRDVTNLVQAYEKGERP